LVESSPMEDDAKLFSSNVAAFGIELKDALGVPTVSEESAIAIARKDIAGMIVGDAGHITAMYTRFSDYPAGPDGAPLVLPGTTRVMKDVPVWLVTFHGVYMQHSGPCMMDASGNHVSSTRNPYVFGDTNVVLDAETGEVLEDFSYNTLEAPTIEVATTLPSWNGMSLRDTAVQWAALCGEEHPADIRFVETTRQKAAKLLHGARVDSDDACYAVVLHGKFVDTMAFTPDGRSMYGTTMTFILRSSDGAMTDFGLNDLPYADLDTLGIVKAIAP
ncbi:MAG: hypothetical protein WAW16_05800, partial [Candidatus Cryosericum sp.]